MARPISPPSASISRTRCPLAVPPTAGLHGISATCLGDSVTSPTRRPSRAAAHAASHPACPAPITTTSKSGFMYSAPSRPGTHPDLFSYAELREDVLEQVVGRPLAGHLLEPLAGERQIGQHQLLRCALVDARAGASCSRARPLVEQCEMTGVRDRRRIAPVLAVRPASARPRAAALSSPSPDRRRDGNHRSDVRLVGEPG